MHYGEHSSAMAEHSVVFSSVSLCLDALLRGAFPPRADPGAAIRWAICNIPAASETAAEALQSFPLWQLPRLLVIAAMAAGRQQVRRSAWSAMLHAPDTCPPPALSSPTHIRPLTSSRVQHHNHL